jgi:hypothetical protein
MELALEPDMYAPSINESGNYVDKVPSFHVVKKGLYCLCGSRKDKLYDNYNSFACHVKTKTHQNWLATLNLNKTNFFIENAKLTKTIHSQKIIISQQEKDISNKIRTISYLTEMLSSTKTSTPHSTELNLIEFD